MAIPFAKPRYISRSSGGNAVHSAAYNMRERLYEDATDRLTPRLKDVGDHVHHEILLPPGANTRFAEAGTLWNAVEASEHRINSQVAREIVIPLPADTGLDADDRLKLARSFAQAHFVERGLAVQLDIHSPRYPPWRRASTIQQSDASPSPQYWSMRSDQPEARNGHQAKAEDPDRAVNYHAHLLATTRRIEGDRLSAHKARDVDPVVRHVNGHPLVVDGDLWGTLWRDHQNKFFEARGMELRVDPTAAIPGEHIGPVRFRHPDDPRIAEAETRKQLNAEFARNPEAVVLHLTHQKAFTQKELSRFLAKHIEDPVERATVQAEAEVKLRRAQREALERATWADKTQGGLRRLLVEDIVREMSAYYAPLIKADNPDLIRNGNPDKLSNYAGLLREANRLREEIRKRAWVRDFDRKQVDRSRSAQGQRQEELGGARKAVHRLGELFGRKPQRTSTPEVPRQVDQNSQWSRLTDPELNKWVRHEARFVIGEEKAGRKEATATAVLNMIERQARGLIEKALIRPPGPDGKPGPEISLREHAGQVLELRQRVARNARAQIETLDRAERLTNKLAERQHLGDDRDVHVQRQRHRQTHRM